MGFQLHFHDDHSNVRPACPSKRRASPLRRVALLAQILPALLIGAVIGDNLLAGSQWSNILIADAGRTIEQAHLIIVGSIRH